MLSHSLSEVSTSMADHYYASSYHTHITRPTTTTSSSLQRKLQLNVSTSPNLFGLYTLLITGAISLLLSCLTLALAGTLLGVMILMPLIILSSPIWVPLFTVVLLGIAGFLSTCVFGVVVLVVGFSWMYPCFKGPTYYQDRTGWATHITGFTAEPGKSEYRREYNGFGY